MRKKWKIFFVPFVCLVLLGLFVFSFMRNKEIKKEVKIRNFTFKVEVVSQKSAMLKGLSGRQGICDECGMLFEFDKPGQYAFWMKDMLFPLDILWIDDGRIVYMEKNINQLFRGSLIPDKPANKVLEINAGKSDQIGIEIGDSVQIQQ